MKLSGFVSFILVLTIAWMQFYASVRETFNGTSEYKAEITRLKQARENERIAFNLEREQFLEFRQNVATLMPNLLKEKGLGEEGYPYRSLASVSTKGQASEVREAIAKTLFETGKEHFRKNDFDKANRAFKQIVDKFSYTPFAIESYFLMAEGLYQKHEFEECTTVINRMVDLFPQHELTGFALIRLGKIYEARNRPEEAADMYKTVIRSFPQRDVASQAKASLRNVEL